MKEKEERTTGETFSIKENILEYCYKKTEGKTAIFYFRE